MAIAVAGHQTIAVTGALAAPRFAPGLREAVE